MNEDFPSNETPAHGARAIPGKRYYVLGGGIIGGGIIGFWALLIWGLTTSNQTDLRVFAPGSETIVLPEPGEYTIFHEYESAYRGNRFLSGKQLPEMSISLIHEASGKEITPYPIPIDSSSTYTARGRKGLSAFRFRANEAGPHRIRTEFLDPGEAGTRVLAIKYWNLSRVPLIVARSWIALILPTALGLFIVTHTAAKRRPNAPSPLLPLRKYFR